jgi:serine/threonine protein phosphatase PrpC
VKSCPTCGASAGDEDVFCEVDGARLASSATTTNQEPGAAQSPAPSPRDGKVRCAACGATNSEGGDGYCGECGHRLIGAGSTLPGATPAKVGDYTVTRAHGDGDLVVKDRGGTMRLLLFGQADAMRLEASALSSGLTAGVFPEVQSQGEADPIGHYLVVRADVERCIALDKAQLSFPAALAFVRAVLDAAAELEARGFVWEPVASDVGVSPEGALQVMRVRGARRLATGESFNAKKVLEALGATLVPTPLGLGTPGLVRLFLPRSNFSTAAVEAITAAREELVAAEATLAKRCGDIAELCDPGLRRNHNEDATAVAEGEIRGEAFKVLVVCDGVSSSTHAEQASSIASKVARDALAHFARSGDILREGSSSAVAAAIRAAHVAVCTSQIEFGSGPPPGTTIVAALVFRKSLTVGWVGDSRAYWISEHGADLCTTDHSWINEVVARGEMTEAVAMQSPLAHALTKCLGPLETDATTVQDVEPEVRTKALPGPGKLVLCTDGLWNYFPAAPAIAGLVHGAGKDADPAAIARFLICHALAQGGGDNVSVAVLDVR